MRGKKRKCGKMGHGPAVVDVDNDDTHYSAVITSRGAAKAALVYLWEQRCIAVAKVDCSFMGIIVLLALSFYIQRQKLSNPYSRQLRVDLLAKNKRRKN